MKHFNSRSAAGKNQAHSGLGLKKPGRPADPAQNSASKRWLAMALERVPERSGSLFANQKCQKRSQIICINVSHPMINNW